MKTIYKGLLLAICTVGLNSLSWGQCFNPAVTPQVNTNAFAVATGDFNGDGKPDIVAANSNNNAVLVLPNNGSGGFGSFTNYNAGDSPGNVATGDFNTDGKPDIAVTNSAKNIVSILLNDGMGSFKTPIGFGAGFSPVGLAVNDFNGDGKPDLAASNYITSTVSILINNGAGGFNTATSVSAGFNTGPKPLAVGDFNGDGKPDIISGNILNNYNGSSISVLANSGSGSFSAVNTVSLPGLPNAIAVGDFNGDGKSDVVATTSGPNATNISILIGNGTGGFSPVITTGISTGAVAIAVSDLNADGKLDLAVTSVGPGANTVSVLLGNGNGTFVNSASFATGIFPVGVAVADFNSDGKADLATANSSDNAVSILLNCMTTPAPPVTSTGLTLTTPAYDCITGLLTLTTTGGNGQPIDYRIAGLRDYNTSATFTIPAYQRTNTSFTLEARQSGVVVTLPFTSACQSVTTTTSPDLGPLVDFYNATNGSGWTNHTNWLQGSSPCNWYGVTCDGDGRVTELRFNQNNLNGTLPASLGNLSQLKSLTIFQETNLSGTLPTSLGNLSQLQTLNIEYTQISGNIPESLGNLKQLTSLFLAVNNLTGAIPASLGSLPQLQNLYLFINQLTGCIPTTFSALCGKDVRLSGNAGLPSGGDFTAFCATGAGSCQSPTQPTGTGLTLTTPAYDCNSGQLTLSTTGGNGTTIDYRIAGLRDYATSPTFTVPAYQLMGTSFILEARQSGVVVTLPFTSVCQSTTTTPPTSPTQTTGGTLSVSAQPLNCQTGALQLVTTGGDGTPIDFKVPGLRDYGSSALFTVPAYQRTNTTFTLYARQNGREVTGTYAATCPVSGRLASAEASGEFRVVVYPNPVGEQFSVGVSGASGQLVRFHLTNLSGQTVVEQRAQVSSDAHSETLRLPASGAGLYLLQVSTDNQSRTVKVLKP